MSKKALFLDRDGVINIEKDYLHKIEDFEFIEGIFDLCHFFQTQGFAIFVVTNQSGIARGYYSEEDFQLLTEWMLETFKKENIEITHVYHCPHHPDISGECACRKPHPGMLNEAIEHYDIDVQGSLLVGDKERDIEAAYAAGLSFAYLFTDKPTATTATQRVSRLQEIIESFHDAS